MRKEKFSGPGESCQRNVTGLAGSPVTSARPLGRPGDRTSCIRCTIFMKFSGIMRVLQGVKYSNLGRFALGFQSYGDLKLRGSLCSGSVCWTLHSTWEVVVWPTTSCFADWSKCRHVTLRIIDCQEVVLTCYRIFTTCHPRPRDMSTHLTWSRVTCCKYSTKMKSRVRFPADH